MKQVLHGAGVTADQELFSHRIDAGANYECLLRAARSAEEEVGHDVNSSVAASKPKGKHQQASR